MWIKAITLRGAPGVAHLELPELSPGVTVVLGPNASGKSTLARALRSLFDPEACDDARVEILFEHEGRAHHLIRRPGIPSPWHEVEGKLVVAAGVDPKLYTLDLSELTRPGKTDEALARDFTRELFGGIDIEAVREAFAPPGASRHFALGRMKEARQALDARRRKVAAIANDEARLDALRGELAEARRARDDLEAIDHLETLLNLRAERAACEGALARLDPAIARIEADAPGRLEELEGELAQAAAAHADAREACRRNAAERARLERDASSTGGSGLSRLDEAKALEAVADALRADTQRLDTARKARAAAEAGEREACALFFVPPAAAPSTDASAPEAPAAAPADPPLGEAAAAALDAAVSALLETEARLEGLRLEAARARAEQDAALEHAKTLGLPDNARALHTGLDALLTWLACSPERDRRAFAAFGAAALLGGAGLGVLFHALIFWNVRLVELVALLLAGAALGFAGWLLPRLLSRDSAGPERARAETDARKAGVAPERFTRPEVETRVGQIFEVMAKGEVLARQLELCSGRVDEVQARLDGVRAEAARAARRFGLSPELPTLSAHERARRLLALIEAKSALKKAAAEVERLEEGIAGRSAPLGAFLEAFGLFPGDDPAALEAGLTLVVERLTTLAALEAGGERLQEVLAAAKTEEERRKKKLEAAFAAWQLAPGERERLIVLAAQRPDRDALETRLAELQRDSAQLLGRFDPEGLCERLGLALDRLSPSEITPHREALKSRASREDPLRDEISDIESQVNVAGEGDALARARARLDEARLGLDTARDEAMHKHLVQLCLDDAVARFEAEHRPARQERARTLFARFTRNHWSLELDSAQSTFAAVDTSLGLRRRPSELSEGTLVHLLLAVRLAAIEAAERGGSALPLCLDELLSTTDPSRFEEIAAALFSVAAEGRQILYFTADPAEAAQWQAAATREGFAELKIVKLRHGEVAAWGDTLTLAPCAIEPVPAPPGDQDPDTYARLLGLPPPDAHHPASAWHLLHLLYDHLEAANALLAGGLTTLGQWRAALCALDPGTRPPFVEAEVAELIEARAALLEATLQTHGIGRGRPLRWHEVEESGAVSKNFLGRAGEIFEACVGDARRFIEGVGDLKGFRQAKREALHEHLLDTGALGTGDVLDAATLMTRVLARSEAARDEGPIAVDDARAFVAHILSLIERPRAAGDAGDLRLVGGDDV